ncbi:Aminoacyl tRNA synthase complex-interacting multifunctional protein 2-like [Oopsacas minuta]|uniref:Aminoacyl tRNA synthase complex-interacting multifunctional protein 2-like n=1 Tax=Oopsacas minuta TaxID=111878 RepID=A0AAV7JWU3_9METZ|nr:Aminoacyl tRNA synthase complex-interacting multifunctional protein 2-like [Oopsacas minuta]
MAARSTPVQPMYHMRPYTFPNEPVYPSTSGMYRMAPYFPARPPSSASGEMNVSNDVSSYSEDDLRQLESVHLEIEKELGSLKTRVDACNKKTLQLERESESNKVDRGNQFAKLEKRQDSINQMVTNLKHEMNLLKQQRRTASPRSTPEPAKQSTIQPPPIPVDAVVKCHPDNPPSATLLVFSHLQKYTPVSWRSMCHSTLSTPYPLSSTLLQHVEKSIQPKLILTLIWKGEADKPTLQISASQTTIYCDHTIAKYLCRLYAEDLYEESTPQIATEIDHWINSFSMQLLAGSSKEKQNLIKNLNAHFGKNRWLVGDQMSLADIVAFSYLTNRNILEEIKLQKNVTEWIKQTSLELPFSLPTLQPLFTIPQS